VTFRIRVVVAMSLLFLFFSLGVMEGPTPGVDVLSAAIVFKLSMAISTDFLRKAVKMSTAWGASFAMISETKKIY